MNERIRQLMLEAGYAAPEIAPRAQKLVELVARECIKSLEAHEIPVGNSPAGEMACEWTYEALKEVRADIKEKFGIK
jgi:hypothetical protein